MNKFAKYFVVPMLCLASNLAMAANIKDYPRVAVMDFGNKAIMSRGLRGHDMAMATEYAIYQLSACGWFDLIDYESLNAIAQMHKINMSGFIDQGTAVQMGRIAGDIITGGTLEHRGILGTGIVRVFDLAVAYTGLTEKEAKLEGLETAILYNIKPDHADYLGGKELTIKALADKSSGRILGAQIIGEQGVDKRIVVIATAISFGAVAEDLLRPISSATVDGRVPFSLQSLINCS